MCCALSQSSVLYFREVLSKMSRVTEELRSYDKDKSAGLGDRDREQGVNLVNLSDRVHSEYRITFILKGGVRGGQERWTELLDKGRQGSDGWGYVLVRNAWQGRKECDGM
jgi:hypothetical protein